jgi:dTDP-4-dehydrorhamnose reductase
MKILITGKSGQLGHELAKTFRRIGQVVALDRNQLDLSKTEKIAETVRDIKPGLIINAAAYTAVDLAEKEADIAVAVNSVAPGVLADEANRLDVPLIHYSTDYVFDGSSTTPYRETDATAPLGVYGRSKRGGELAVALVAKRHLIMRVSWLYANRGKNFFLTMQRLMRERDTLSVVNDQIGAPTWVHHVAQTTKQILKIARSRAEFAVEDGTYHVASAGTTSWHGFASAILANTMDPERKVKEIRAIATAEYPTPAKRPAYSVLDCTKIELALGVKMPHWEDQLRECAKEAG